jgi:FdhE protein
VSETSYQKREQRAHQLASQYGFAAEIFTFYSQLVRFQAGVYQGLKGQPEGFSGRLEIARLKSHAAAFFLMVEKHGPARLADVALSIRSNQADHGWPNLLYALWTEPRHVPSEPEEFLAHMFLQPYAEWVRSGLPPERGSSSQRLCPYCGRSPFAAVLRPLGDGASRSLLCSFCLAEWEFRRILCPSCSEEDNTRLPVYTAADFPNMRVECCDTCKKYLKATDLTKFGHADPLVDELASAPLDLWAQERGYSKLHPNLLGL